MSSPEYLHHFWAFVSSRKQHKLQLHFLFFHGGDGESRGLEKVIENIGHYQHHLLLAEVKTGLGWVSTLS